MNIHQKNLQILVTYLETKNNLGPKIIKDTKPIHFIQKPYNLRNDSELQRCRNHTVYFGTESISLHASKIWELIPSGIRNASFGLQINVLTDFVKHILAMWVSIKSVLKK